MVNTTLQGFSSANYVPMRKTAAILIIISRGGYAMNTEREIVQHALNWYLSDLRQEIVKTEKHEMKQQLHREETVLKEFLYKISHSDPQSPESACAYLVDL